MATHIPVNKEFQDAVVAAGFELNEVLIDGTYIENGILYVNKVLFDEEGTILWDRVNDCPETRVLKVAIG